MTLKNPGKVEFDYFVLTTGSAGELVPGTLAVTPSTVSAAFVPQCVCVCVCVCVFVCVCVYVSSKFV